MKKLKGSSYSLLVIMAITLAMVARSAYFPRLQTKLMPMALGSVVFLLSAAELVRELRTTEQPRKRRKHEDTAEQVKKPRRAPWKAYAEYGGWLAGFFAAIYLFGFLVSIPAFVLSYFKTHGGGWVSGIILTVVLTAFIWVAFEYFLKINLREGLLLNW